MRLPGGPRIERIFNLKYPLDSIRRFNEILQRKQAVEQFYAAYS